MNNIIVARFSFNENNIIQLKLLSDADPLWLRDMAHVFTSSIGLNIGALNMPKAELDIDVMRQRNEAALYKRSAKSCS